MPRFFAIDYGSRRIGLAVGDDHTKVSTPVSTLKACGMAPRDVETVLAATKSYAFDAFVVGLPMNMDGTEGRQAEFSRRFGDLLARRSGKPVHYVDERLSSVAADERLQPEALTRKKRKAVRDAVAAQVILEDFLRAQPP